VQQRPHNKGAACMSRATVVYIGMFVALAVGLLAILRVGGRLHAPAETQPTSATPSQARAPAPAPAAPPARRGGELLTLFMQIALIVALSRTVGWVFAQFHQPQVMGEMLAGILLGPSLFGWLAGDASRFVFPPGSEQYLNVLSQVGVVFFLFLVGLELDPKLLRSRGHAAVVISHASIIAPFLLGAGLCVYLYPRVFTAHIAFTSAALFMGAAMSITAFPVLARILTERNLTKTKIGAVSITCAAVDDVTAWCMLAFVVAVARLQSGGGSFAGAIWTAITSAIYVVAMFLIVRPLLRRLEVIYDRRGLLSQNIMSIVFLLILLSAYTTETIGIHALFGAFLMGAIMPKGTDFVRHLGEKLEDFTVVFLLPIFFAFTGLRTRIQLLNDSSLLLDAALIIFVACLGKFGGSTMAARACGLEWRESAAIGTLMNTRGLMELVILNVGRDLGVITDSVFAMMVIMALVTTALTTPVLNWIYPRRLLAERERKARTGGGGPAFSILIPVALPKSGGPLVQLADTIIGASSGEAGSGKLYALHLRRPADHPTFRSGLEEAEQTYDESLAPLLAQARARGLPVEPLSFISRDVPAEINDIAKERQVNLVLIGFHKPIFGRGILGGTVHQVLTGCETDVAIFVDRGFRQARRILVPYLGTEHDRLALVLAARMARNTDAQVTVLHVTPPLRGESARSLDARGNVERVFQDPAQAAPVIFRVVEDPSPVGVVLHQAPQFDLVIIGVAEQWGLESHLFGWRAERIARDCPSSMLIVRKHAAARALAPTAPIESAAPLSRGEAASKASGATPDPLA
jgi:Kef-type K+ transport system membrane component KefB/nucleotide-binding universal stress UspA family protein